MNIYTQFDKLYGEYAKKYNLPLNNTKDLEGIAKMYNDSYDELEQVLDEDKIELLIKFRVASSLLCEYRLTEATTVLLREKIVNSAKKSQPNQ